MIDSNGKQLYDLVIEYLFYIQNKPIGEVKKTLKQYNLKWVGRCRTFNRSIVDPNPHGFRESLKNKEYINKIREDLSLDPPALNFFQRLFYFY